MSYLTFDEYQNFGGELDETTFDNLEFEAETFVDYYTFDRLHNVKTIPDGVKRCIYNIIDIANKKQQAFSLGQDLNGNVQSAIASQSNDGVSISYNTMSAGDLFKIAENEIEMTVRRYLQSVRDDKGRRLLYRGLYPDE
jgi:hypothetical protein